jgi:hypothetical protein
VDRVVARAGEGDAYWALIHALVPRSAALDRLVPERLRG